MTDEQAANDAARKAIAREYLQEPSEELAKMLAQSYKPYAPYQRTFRFGVPPETTKPPLRAAQASSRLAA